MKNLSLHRILTACLCLNFAAAVCAQDAISEVDPFTEQVDPSSKLIRVQVEFIDVSHEQFTELMFGPKPSANDGELRQQVAQLIKDGKASVVETLLCSTRSGQKATSESIEEYIYPTEYEPAELATDTVVKAEKGMPDYKAKKLDFAIGPMPTAFDTRNVGSTLEIEPILSRDLKTIELRFSPEIVYHVGNEVWAEWKGKHGNSPVQMPTFYTIRTTTIVILTKGHYMLAAAVSPKNKDGVSDFTRKLMMFVKADVVETGR